MATTNIAYFEFKSGGSDKFYLMEQDPNGTSFTARYGRCGTTGSVATYPMSKWNSVYNTRVRHGYTDKTQEFLAGRVGTQQSQPQPDGKKFNITGVRKDVNIDGRVVTVYRITATREIETVEGSIVSAGEFGGWIEYPSNLSQNGKCWIDDEAVVYGSGGVKDDALVADHAICGGTIGESAVVRGNAKVSPLATCNGHCLVCDDATVDMYANITDSVTVAENGAVGKRVTVRGDTYVSRILSQ